MNWAVRCVWMRYFDVFRRNLTYGVITTFVEPVLFLLSFGFGVGALVPQITVDHMTVTYRQFVLAGIIGQSVLFQSFFEAAYGAFVRMYYQRIFQAMAMTPITLSEVLWGELLWDTSKAMFAACAVLALGVVLGDFSLMGALGCLPIILITCLIFSALGLLAAAHSKTIDAISYPQYLFVFPMFLFCGVFFPLQNLPQAAQWFAWALPLTSFLSLVRSLVLGLPFQWYAIPILLLWCAILVPWARKAMIRRIVP